MLNGVQVCEAVLEIAEVLHPQERPQAQGPPGRRMSVFDAVSLESLEGGG